MLGTQVARRRWLYLTAISLFLIGSLLCEMGNSIYELAAFRAIQYLGSGGLMSLALTIMVPVRQPSRYEGYFMAVFGTTSVIGPVIGGLAWRRRR